MYYFKLFTLGFLSLPLIVLQTVISQLGIKGRGFYFISTCWHRLICKFVGLKIEVVGTPVTSGQVITIANHLSYLDIPVISSVIHGSYIARGDMASWPVVGFLAKLQHTLFISRKPTEADKALTQVKQSLQNGYNLIIFPEGTSTNGVEVKPFKSSLFSLITPDMIIQPLTISILELNGNKITQPEQRDFYAWHGDMGFTPHFPNLMTGKGGKIRLTFHEPVTVKDGFDRKKLSENLRNIIDSGLASA